VRHALLDGAPDGRPSPRRQRAGREIAMTRTSVVVRVALNYERFLAASGWRAASGTRTRPVALVDRVDDAGTARARAATGARG